MPQSRSRRAAWRGWLASVLLHGVVAVGLVIALRHRPSLPTEIPSNNTVCSDRDFSLTIWDEPVRIAQPKSPAASPALPSTKPDEPIGPITPVVVAPKALPTDTGPLLTPVDPKLVPPQPNISPVAVSPAVALNPSPGPREAPGDGSPGGAGPRSQLPASPAARSVVFVLDRSASMGIDDRLDLAREQILATLRRLPPGARFQVVYYNRRVDSVSIGGRTGLVPVTAESLAQLSAALGELIPEGGNDHGPALRAALALEPDAVYLLTDADDLTLEQVKEVTAWNRGHSVIHAVTIGSAPRQAMKLLAVRNGGICATVAARR